MEKKGKMHKKWIPRGNECSIHDCERDWDAEECCPDDYYCYTAPGIRPICMPRGKTRSNYSINEPIGDPHLFTSTRSNRTLPQEAIFDPFLSTNGKWRQVTLEEHQKLWRAVNELFERMGTTSH
jgi:hypothetical protein